MKTVFITGSSRGLGLEFTKQYLEKGYHVIASCRTPEKAKALRKEKPCPLVQAQTFLCFFLKRKSGWRS